MLIVKKSNQQEKFSSEKLARSLQNANASTGDALDIGLLLAEFQNIAADKDFLTTGQINVIVYGLLFSKKAFETLKNYSKFEKYE